MRFQREMDLKYKQYRRMKRKERRRKRPSKLEGGIKDTGQVESEKAVANNQEILIPTNNLSD